MMKAQAVIGALYGDEGKGKHVDFLAHAAMRDHGSCIVVRSNGGAQAGHTVVTPEGLRHIFSHFGSGTFAGATTYLSKFMITNPIMFNREWDELVALGVTPTAVVSPDSIVTFPQDMLMNQMLETLRGNTRHGSCGLGIGETMHRHESYRLTYRVGDLNHIVNDEFERVAAFKKLNRAMRTRLDGLGLHDEDLPAEYRPFLRDERVFESFVSECFVMLSRITIMTESDLPEVPIVFEAAQGLALDRDMGFFPYVTRSKTGMFNIATLCREMGVTDIEAIYTMRAYTTRHGAGPLDGEIDMSEFGYTINDPTNAPNDWQGSIRAAPLDLWLANRMIELDLAGANTKGLNVTKKIAISCLDQVPEHVAVFDIDRVARDVHREELWDHVMAATNAQGAWASYGPTRDDIVHTY